MGTFYQNVTLRGAAPDAVVAVLAELGRTAFVTKPAGPITVVFDSEIDAMQAGNALPDLAGTLSVRLKCPALAAGVYDDDVLYLSLFEGLESTFEYVSTERRVANLSHFCSVMGLRPAVLRSWLILKAPHFIPYLFETFRYLHLLRALGLPEWPYTTGYRSIERGGEAPAGLGMADLIRLRAGHVE